MISTNLSASLPQNAELDGREGSLNEQPSDTPKVMDSTPPPMAGTRRYRWRMIITLLVLLVAWIGAGFSPTFLQTESLPAILADYVGWLMFFGGLSLRFWATWFIGGRKAREVVCYGPYSLTRNPLYVGTFLMIMSLAFVLKSPTFAVATLIVIAYYCVAVVPLEERLLRHQFGLVYANYCHSVPRWLPRFGTVYSPPVSMISHPMRNELRRALWWLPLPLLAELHTYCRNLPEWPHWLNWP
ncbi:MAG: isoprenylcysteine carboxylmethyltransferase family protein [Planctomycetaceae bacterium]|nr:isoprenylcysteine carboxylmethyltransferase family protein [Planctomycetaceae bacterium]